MKIGLNTYSFRNELKNGTMNLDDVLKVAKNLEDIQGFELLDRHIPGYPKGDINAGIKQFQEKVQSKGFEIYALGPHTHLWRFSLFRNKEIKNFKKWIDLAADYGIPNMRTQIGGKLSSNGDYGSVMKSCIEILDKVLPYAEERGVLIGLETHHRASSWPPFLDELTEKYKDSPSLGIIFDWGNFPNNKDRYDALKIATRTHNHCHNHVKIFNFGDKYQEEKYDSYKIVHAFKEANFKDYFSIEWEGKHPALEGVFKSVEALKYAIKGGKYKINTDFDWNSLVN